MCIVTVIGCQLYDWTYLSSSWRVRTFPRDDVNNVLFLSVCSQSKRPNRAINFGAQIGNITAEKWTGEKLWSRRICLPKAVHELLNPIYEENLQLAEVDDEDPSFDASSSLGDNENPSNIDICTLLVLENENDLYAS